MGERIRSALGRSGAARRRSAIMSGDNNTAVRRSFFKNAIMQYNFFNIPTIPGDTTAAVRKTAPRSVISLFPGL